VTRTVEIAPTFEDWQAAARTLLHDGVPPAEVRWRERAHDEQPSLLTAPAAPPPSGGARVPRKFLDLAREAAAAADPGRWQVLYEVLWRLVHENHDLLEAEGDPATRRLKALTKREGEGAAPLVPPGANLAELRAAAAKCTGCELYRYATQTVFGRGPADAAIVFVGEQPGDQEDRKGAPFVGPAGEVFDRALAEVGLDRTRVYVTNAVKHFKFVEKGKRRIHQTPRMSELTACRPWLEAELALIKPGVLVCLGATAAHAIFGASFRLMQDHGRFTPTRWADKTIATLHPSAVLRGEDETQQARLYGILLEDLRLVAAA
jgi:uracil-DNA glycosylase